MDRLLSNIEQEFSGKEFTKKDLMELIRKMEPEPKPETKPVTDVNTATTDTKSVNLHTRSDFLDTALSLKDFRTSGTGIKEMAWQELYESDEYCKVLIEWDIEKLTLEQELRIMEEFAKRNPRKKQCEQSKQSNLTKEERGIKWRSLIDAHKDYIIESMGKTHSKYEARKKDIIRNQ